MSIFKRKGSEFEGPRVIELSIQIEEQSIHEALLLIVYYYLIWLIDGCIYV